MASPQGVFELTQSKYTRKRVPSTEQASIEENEVRITTQGRVKRYADYAVRLLNGPQEREKDEDEKANENENTDRNEKTGPTKQFDTIVLKATGRAIYSAVTTAEVVKRKVANLYQTTNLDTLEMTDVWEPQEEGLKEVKTTRRVASICIILSRNQSEMDVNGVGYQEPIPAESVGAGGVGRGWSRGRGSRGNRGNRGNRGGRGGFRGRGGGGAFRENNYEDNRNYDRGYSANRGGRKQEFSNDNQERDFRSNRRFGGNNRGFNRNFNSNSNANANPNANPNPNAGSRPRGRGYQNFENSRQQNRR